MNSGSPGVLEDFDFVVRVAPRSSRDQIQRYYATCFTKYCAIDPRLAALGLPAVRELVSRCHQQAACRSAQTAGAAG
jgi:hypothetical protein